MYDVCMNHLSPLQYSFIRLDVVIATATANAIAAAIDAVATDATVFFLLYALLCFFASFSLLTGCCYVGMVYKSDDAIAAYFDFPCRFLCFSLNK